MAPEQQNGRNFLFRIGDAVRKNYRIISLRMQIGRIERKKTEQYTLLGRRLFKLIKTRRVDLPEQKKLMSDIDCLDELLEKKCGELTKLIQS